MASGQTAETLMFLSLSLLEEKNWVKIKIVLKQHIKWYSDKNPRNKYFQKSPKRTKQ